MTEPKYSRWNPNKVHMLNGQPVIYNKVDNPIMGYQAERQWKKSIHTMHTWASRYFRLTAAQPDAQLREYELERIDWDLDNIESWLGAMREALENERKGMRKQETIDKIIALAESTTFPGEAETARRMAARRQAGDNI